MAKKKVRGRSISNDALARLKDRRKKENELLELIRPKTGEGGRETALRVQKAIFALLELNSCDMSICLQSFDSLTASFDAGFRIQKRE